MTPIRFNFIFLFVCLLLTQIGCDSLPGTSDLPSNTIQLERLTITPNPVSFALAKGVRDTLVTVQVLVKASSDAELEGFPLLHFYNKTEAELILSDTLSTFNSANNTYSGTFTFQTSTGFSGLTELIVTGLTKSKTPSNSLRSSIPIIGFSIQPPQLVRAVNPDTVTIPTSGSVSFLLGAEVTHPESNTFINRVLVEIVDKNNVTIGTFRLYDDGSLSQIEGGGSSGDIIANDTFFSRAFTLSSTNQADELTLTFYAVDVSEQESNRITTKMVFKK